MTTTDKTKPDQTDTIEFELELAHPPAKVWRALTQPELLGEWLLPAIDFRLEKGADFRFQTRPYPGWDGIVNCKMLEIEAERKLRYAWTAFELDTVVTFTLEPQGQGTRLEIVQSGFQPSQAQNFGGARYGWNMMGQKLVELLGRPS